MSKIDIFGVFKSIGKSVKNNVPGIATGLGIASMAAATILAVKVTPKAMFLINKREKELGIRPPKSISRREAVKASWKCYIPSAICAFGGAACIISGQTINLKRNAALAAACSLSEAALKEYRDKVVEVIGEKKEQAVHDAIAKDRMEKDPVSSNEVIMTGKGETLCYDALSGRYFKSDIEKLKKIENILNRRMIGDMTVSLNEFYQEIGLPEIPIGDMIGWNVNRFLIEMRFSSQLADDGTPCLVVGYIHPPEHDFDRY